MLGHSILTSSTTMDDRVFIYEVEGLRQSDQSDRGDCVIRQSSTEVVQVPFNQMNDFMQRMNRLGVKIVSIRTSH